MNCSTQRLATSSALALMAEVFAISDAVRAVAQPPNRLSSSAQERTLLTKTRVSQKAVFVEALRQCLTVCHRSLLFKYALRFRLISSVGSQRPEATRPFESRRFGLILRNEARLMTGGIIASNPTDWGNCYPQRALSCPDLKAKAAKTRPGKMFNRLRI